MLSGVGFACVCIPRERIHIIYAGMLWISRRTTLGFVWKRGLWFCVDVVSRPKSNWNAAAFYVHDADQRRLAHHSRLSHGVGEKGVVGP